MASLVDVNVWLALVVPDHEHHARAADWFDNLSSDAAVLCRVTQFGLVRLLCTQSVMLGKALAPGPAWEVTVSLLQDSRVAFQSEPLDLASFAVEMLSRQMQPSPKFIGDAYLASFAAAADLHVVTFDKGFQQFSEIKVQLL